MMPSLWRRCFLVGIFPDIWFFLIFRYHWLVVGPQRDGDTWLAQAIDQHAGGASNVPGRTLASENLIRRLSARRAIQAGDNHPGRRHDGRRQQGPEGTEQACANDQS